MTCKLKLGLQRSKDGLNRWQVFIFLGSVYPSQSCLCSNLSRLCCFLLTVDSLQFQILSTYELYLEQTETTILHTNPFTSHCMNVCVGKVMCKLTLVPVQHSTVP